MHWKGFVAGVGLWTFVEYATHRWILHGPLLRWHLPHHRNPHDGVDWKAPALAGLLTGYVAYTYLHHALHEGYVSGKLERRHDRHHDIPTRSFGVTSNFWDKVFKTR